MAVRGSIDRFIRSFGTRGVVGTISHYGRVAASVAHALTPTGRREREARREQDLKFSQKLRRIDTAYDSTHHLDTGGKIELHNLSIDSESKVHGVFYQAIFPDRFFECIETLKVDPHDYVFVDIGSGKGRALFLAQDMGFKSVVGVEFARELVEICKDNIRRRALEGVSRPPLQILHMDGLLYDLPEEPTVLFLYNPFGAPLMTRMAERIRKSLSDIPRSLKIVYVNPLHDSVITSTIPDLKRLAQTRLFNSYEWYPPQRR